MSTVDDSLRAEIKKRFEQERAEIKLDYERKKLKLAKAREDMISKSTAPPPEAAPAAAAVAPPAAPEQHQPAHSQPAARGSSSTDQPRAAERAAYTPSRPDNRPDHRSDNRSESRPDHRSDNRSESRPDHRSDSRSENRPDNRSDSRPASRPDSRPDSRSDSRPASRPDSRPDSRSDNRPDNRGRDTFKKPGTTFGAPAPTPPPSEDKAASQKKNKKRGGKKKFDRPEVDEIELRANIKKTLAQIGSGSERKKYKKDRTAQDDEGDQEKKTLNVSEFVTANELAIMMKRPVAEVIAKCLELGLFVTINQRLDFETIAMVADEFDFNAELMSEYTPEEEDIAVEENEADLKPRAPVVTVMGHVDHGKTSLLDYVRKTNVIAGESGGITQHIAAYEVRTKHGPVTFLDTPGHEAFTAMRARGSQITDVIVLVVAADSAVMPQTREAIDHARAANVPLVIAINKVDLPTANPEKIRTELSLYNVLVEDWGGQISCVEISAKTGQGIDRLLEILALETDIMELKANPTGFALGVVVESELDKGKGPIATVLIQKGTLKRGDAFVTGMHNGRVRELFDERGNAVDCAGPSRPVVVLGLTGTPQAGDSFRVVADEKEAREIAGRRRLAQKERELRRMGTVSLDHLYEQIQEGKVQTLNLIIKGDVDGSVEALAASLEQLSTSEIKVHVIHKSVGAIKETDIMLAAASTALIIGFHLSPNSKIREMARNEGVDIRIFRIIYEAVDAVKKAMEGLLAPEIQEKIMGQVEIRAVFKITKVGLVAGCRVLSGTIMRNAKARLIREDIEVCDTRIGSLRREHDDVREVASGYECGIILDRFTDYREGDRIEVYEEISVARKLE
jgi:translation initiation factor IF-2